MAAKPKQIAAIAASTENTEHVGAAMAAKPETNRGYSRSYRKHRTCGSGHGRDPQNRLQL